MNPEPTPWETAAKKMKSSFATVALIKETCEAHATAMTAERDRLAAQLKLANEDWAEDDTAIRDLCRPILGDAAVEGDSYGVPSVVELVEKLVGELKRNDTRTPI